MGNAILVAQRYFDAWNSRDASAIHATFAEEGTYHDPATGEIRGDAVGDYAKHLWAGFPDLSFEIMSIAETGPNMVAAQWVMKGTNTGSFQGLPPSGRSISLPGADFVEVEGNQVKSVRGYFDTRAIPEQIGLQVLVQPVELGPFTFGNSVAVHSGKRETPGAFSITAIWNEDEHTEDIRSLSRQTAQEMLKMEGFIGVMLVRIGRVGMTISAWEKPENTAQLMRSGAHSDAMRRFWEHLGKAAYTSVWIPHHINPFWVRCTACNKMEDYEKSAGVCSCGQSLPERPSYF